MKIKSAEFIKSAVTNDQYPVDNLPEILLSGRSNVGKSSFINSVLNRKNIAHISGRPGKTQTLNFYLINNSFYFVDVPGYGYARVSKKDRENFGQMIEDYFVYRKQLSLVVLLIDFRHKPSEDDVIMYDYLTSYEIPCLVIGTKVDKVPKTKRIKNEKLIKSTLKMSEDDLFLAYSSETKFNLDSVHDILSQVVGE
ncbi:ribosome biogenesis GTP-binding protein YihA/YsxC [Candidatus Izimaplasma bacterium]|nr:ribosome biogenesis GTP-binding protein YihA/YsxC [Candidatus Izimaplasma bacterium]